MRDSSILHISIARLSLAGVAFDYRMVAKRLGYESKRLVDMQPMLEKLKSSLHKRTAATTRTIVDRH